MKRLVLALALLVCATAPAAAEDAEPDTTLHDFLEELSDSTDAYFGLTAAPLDTAGLDSALAHGLAFPRSRRQSSAVLRIGLIPDFSFNRVDGPVWGGGFTIGRESLLGQLRATAGYAAGPNEWLGEGRYTKSWWRRDVGWTLQLRGGVITESMEREYPEHQLTVARALLTGKDHKHYLRREGAGIRLVREATTWRAAIGYRRFDESPLVTTTTWNLLQRELSIIENMAATRGLASELGFEAAWRTPRWPITIEGTHHTASKAIGSDLEYRRYRVAVGGNLGIGRHLAAVPQLVYGRLHMAALPQQSFYLGGSHTLRSLEGSAQGGTGLALARIDVIGIDDVLSVLRIPHPDVLPLQLGAFAATGAVWGHDPYGGPTMPGVDWPDRKAWLSEVGVSIHYQVGIPEPTTAIRINCAFALGPERQENRYSISYSRAFDLIRGLGR